MHVKLSLTTETTDLTWRSRSTSWEHDEKTHTRNYVMSHSHETPGINMSEPGVKNRVYRNWKVGSVLPRQQSELKWLWFPINQALITFYPVKDLIGSLCCHEMSPLVKVSTKTFQKQVASFQLIFSKHPPAYDVRNQVNLPEKGSNDHPLTCVQGWMRSKGHPSPYMHGWINRLRMFPMK